MITLTRQFVWLASLGLSAVSCQSVHSLVYGPEGVQPAPTQVYVRAQNTSAPEAEPAMLQPVPRARQAKELRVETRPAAEPRAQEVQSLPVEPRPTVEYYEAPPVYQARRERVYKPEKSRKLKAIRMSVPAATMFPAPAPLPKPIP